MWGGAEGSGGSCVTCLGLDFMEYSSQTSSQSIYLPLTCLVVLSKENQNYLL